MAGLFKNITKLSAEEMDLQQSLETEEGSSELALESVEAFEATDEMLAEADENIELADDIDSTSEDADSLEALHDGLEAEASQEGFEGFDAPTMMSARASLKLIMNNNHMPQPKVVGIITKQSFTGNTSKVQVANSKIVLAGIKDTLVEMWEKIKAGLKMLWDRVKKFWNKHLSTMGRLIKALKSAKTKAKSTKGAPDYSKEVKAGSALSNAFIGTGEIDSRLIETYFKRHAEASAVAFAAIGKLDAWAKSLAEGGSRSAGPDFKTLVLGTEKEPLIGGFYTTVEFEPGDVEDGNKSAGKLTMIKEKADGDSSDDRNMTIPSKAQMEEILTESIKMIEITQKFGKEFDKLHLSYSKNIETINKNIDNASDDKETISKLKAISRTMSAVGGITPNLNASMASNNVKLAKMALLYCKRGMGAYKKSK